MKRICLIVLCSALTVKASAQAQQQKEPASKNSDTIRLRCGGTVAANDIVYIVDGVLVTDKEITQLNPADIVYMDVLKQSDAKTFSCYTQPKPIVIITTKKANRKILHVVDAKTNVGVAAASIKFTFIKTVRAFDFVADDFGRLETDSLVTDEYRITVSATGYEPLTITGKEARQLKYRLKLQPKFIELKEIKILASNVIRCGPGSIKAYACKEENFYRILRCIGYGASVSEEKSSSNRPAFLYQPKIKVYPNPLTVNGTVQLSFSDLKPGVYQIRLLNASGQLLYSFQKQIATKNEIQQLPFHSAMPAGMYMIQVMDENKTLLQSSKLIVQ